MTAYMRWLEAERGLDFGGDYHALWRWSVESIEDFWASIWDYFEVAATRPYSAVLSGHAMPGARWFEGAELNYAEHLFRDKRDDAVAILHASELRELSELTWAQLRDRVARTAAGLRAMGVERGDRVVAYLPNIPEALIAFCATASLGAVWSSCSPDFGARSVVDRFAQIEPKVLFAVDGYRHGGRDFDRLDVVARLEAEIPTLEGTVVLPYLEPEPRPVAPARRAHLERPARRWRPRPAHVRAGRVRPPALGALLVRHDRPPEGDRPGPRRDPARAPEEAQPPRRRARGRPRLLVHDDRLDDVELSRLGAADARPRSSSTTAARARPTWASSGTSPSAPA